MPIIKLIKIIFLMFIYSVATSAAEVEVGGMGESGCDNIYDYEVCVTLIFTGEIKKGDASVLEGFIERTSSVLTESLGRKTRVGKIHFDSKGGHLQESMKIGRLIRKHLIQAQVTGDSECHSSCVIAFAGGVIRLPVGKVGIHSFYSDEFFSNGNPSDVSFKYNQMSDLLEMYLKEIRVSNDLLEHMKRVPHYNIHVLEFEELEKYGLLGIDPVYAQLIQEKPYKALKRIP